MRFFFTFCVFILALFMYLFAWVHINALVQNRGDAIAKWRCRGFAQGHGCITCMLWYIFFPGNPTWPIL